MTVENVTAKAFAGIFVDTELYDCEGTVSVRLKSNLSPAMFLLSFLTTAGFGSAMDDGGQASGPAVFDAAEVDRVVYHFQDASVPPDYHRSYRIEATRKSARIVVDSYGDVLADEVFDIEPIRFDRIKQVFQASGIHNCRLGEETGCTGGTGERIDLYRGEKRLFSGNVYHCGGQDSGDLCGDVFSLAEEMKALISGFEAFLQ